jgi:hypothetical protein
MDRLALLKRTGAPLPTTVSMPGARDEETFERIRCPLCHWRPSASSR